MEKSKLFAYRIVKLNKFLKTEQKEFVMSSQILRSGTSIGANLTEASCAISQKGFLSKVYIALKECAETSYWLELLFIGGYINRSQYDSLLNDRVEIQKMLHSTTKTVRGKLSGDKKRASHA